MKSIILTAITLFLSFASNVLAETTLKEAAQRELERLNGRGGSFSKLAERYQQMFLKYPIAYFAAVMPSEEGKPRTFRIFVSGEEVYIAATQGWNLVADASGVYEWETGKPTGIKTRRNNDDLLSYVNYLGDSGGILSLLYVGYSSRSESCEVEQNKEKGWTELRLKGPGPAGPGSFVPTVFFSEAPFWLHGMRGMRDAKTGEITVSKPREVERVPEEIRQAFKAVKFEESDLSLKRHLRFPVL
jgi:hypothetical protein